MTPAKNTNAIDARASAVFLLPGFFIGSAVGNALATSPGAVEAAFAASLAGVADVIFLLN